MAPLDRPTPVGFFYVDLGEPARLCRVGDKYIFNIPHSSQPRLHIPKTPTAIQMPDTSSFPYYNCTLNRTAIA